MLYLIVSKIFLIYFCHYHKHPNSNLKQPDVLKEKLSENERIMQEMSLTWEQKRFKTGKLSY